MSVIQMQCLLKFLGHYPGPVDGIWGEKSRQATLEFQKRWGLTADGIFGSETEEAVLQAVTGGDWWPEIRYFRQAEFACKCGAYCNGYPAQMSRTAVTLADLARAHFGAPATVVSGLRCEIHNRNVGGVENSRHLTGHAIDLKIRGVSAGQLLEFLRAQPQLRYAYAINDTNVHLDVDA